MIAGVIEEPCEGEDNYLAELVALIDALVNTDDGERVLLIIDATSPVRAHLKFMWSHNRVKMGYYLDRLLDALVAQVARMEVVSFSSLLFFCLVDQRWVTREKHTRVSYGPGSWALASRRAGDMRSRARRAERARALAANSAHIGGRERACPTWQPGVAYGGGQMVGRAGSAVKNCSEIVGSQGLMLPLHGRGTCSLRRSSLKPGL